MDETRFWLLAVDKLALSLSLFQLQTDRLTRDNYSEKGGAKIVFVRDGNGLVCVVQPICMLKNRGSTRTSTAIAIVPVQLAHLSGAWNLGDMRKAPEIPGKRTKR